MYITLWSSPPPHPPITAVQWKMQIRKLIFRFPLRPVQVHSELPQMTMSEGGRILRVYHLLVIPSPRSGANTLWGPWRHQLRHAGAGDGSKVKDMESKHSIVPAAAQPPSQMWRITRDWNWVEERQQTGNRQGQEKKKALDGEPSDCPHKFL